MDSFIVEEGSFPVPRFAWAPSSPYTVRVTIPASRFKALRLGRYEHPSQGTLIDGWFSENLHHQDYAIQVQDIGNPNHRYEILFVKQADAMHFLLRWADVV